MRDKKTTILGIATAVFGFIVFSPELFAQWPWLIALAKYAAVGGLAGLGVVAGDSKKDTGA